MEENVKTQMFPIGLVIAFILIGYYAPGSIFCVSMSTEVQRKAASVILVTPSGVSRQSQPATCQIPAGCTTSR